MSQGYSEHEGSMLRPHPKQQITQAKEEKKVGGHLPSSNLALRLISAAVGVPLILILIWMAPPLVFFFLVFGAGLFASWELFTMTHNKDQIGRYVGLFFSIIVSCTIYFFSGQPGVLLASLLATPLFGLAVTLWRLGSIDTAATRAFALGLGPFYTSGSLTLLALVRRDGGVNGPALAVLAIGFAWVADTGGYFFGRFFGKHKLYEAVSPKKTVEGALGGLIGNFLFVLCTAPFLLKGLPLWHMILLSQIAAVLGIIGDLSESLLKRSLGVKDSGAILPGHGGFLDRIDALLYTSWVMYMYHTFIMRLL